MATISAVIPCYNAGHFLGEALESVRRQTRPVDEIVVVDDCSTDDSAEVARRFGVRYVRTAENAGNAAARNRCIREARGELLAWLDADDFWEPHHIETVAGLLDRHPDAGAAFGAVRLCGAARGVVTPRFPPGKPVDARWEAFWRTAGPQMAAVTRRDAVLAVGGYSETLRSGNDFDLFMRLARRYPLVCTHEVTANYRWHPAQLSSNREGQYRNSYLARLRLRDEARSGGDEALARELEARMRWVWEQDLDSRWRRREMEAVRYFLRFAELVPDAPESVRRRYARRAWLPRRLLRAWDLGPTGLARKLAERVTNLG